MGLFVKVALFFLSIPGICCVDRKCTSLTLPGINMILLNKAFLFQNNISLVQCAKLCWQFRLCASISFKKIHLECRLNYITQNFSPDDYVVNTNAIYIAAEDFLPYGFVDKQRHQCTLSQRHLITRSNKDVCVPFEIKTRNGALGKQTKQSSLYGTFSSSKAVDGVWKSHITGNSCTHTQATAVSWWYVDLGSRDMIMKVKILNRSDCCASRLRNLVIYYGLNLETLDVYGTFQGPGSAGQVITIRNDTWPVGQFVKIVQNYIEALTLCEVSVTVPIPL